MKKIMTKVWVWVADLVLLNGSFVLMKLLRRGSMEMGAGDVRLLALVNGIWLLVSLWNRKKFRLAGYHSRLQVYYECGYAALHMLYLSALFFVVILGYSGFSRYLTLGTFIMLFVFEVLVAEGLIRTTRLQFYGDKKQCTIFNQRVSFRFAVADLALLFLSFYCVLYLKKGAFAIIGETYPILLIHFGLWFVSAGWTLKFHKHHPVNVYYAYSPFVKAAFMMAASFAVIVYVFDLFVYSRILVFAPILLLLVLEAPLSFLHYLKKSQAKADGDVEVVEDVKRFMRQENFELPENGTAKVVEHPAGRVLEQFLKDFAFVLDFIKSVLDVQAIEEKECSVLDTHTLYNIERLNSRSLRLFCNLHEVNDFPRINSYFLEVHRALHSGGYFIGCKERIESCRERIFRKYPLWMAKVVYLNYFIFKRVFPKIAGLREVYFFVSKGKKRAISQAELLGRLYFCGFKVVAGRIINEKFYYIAQKVKTPSFDQDPSYGPIIDLERVGYLGRIIHLKKIRTMHPYSEYIQDYVYAQNNLDENGKIKNDFRVTSWGRVFRKIWLDELPQLVNFVRGDLNLMGVRALSRHYFSLYPKDLQELRIRFKPGLVPPYYADLPKTFEEIVESERRYLQSKLQHSLRTDVIYFFRAWNNIVFKRARSQ